MVSQKVADSLPETISEGEYHCGRNAQPGTKPDPPGPCMPHTPYSSVCLVGMECMSVYVLILLVNE